MIFRVLRENGMLGRKSVGRLWGSWFLLLMLGMLIVLMMVNVVSVMMVISGVGMILLM